MNPPSLSRVKILKFMLSRINEPLTFNEIEQGSHTNFPCTMKELGKLRQEKMITMIGKSYKLSYYDAEFIAKVHTDLAIVCDFSKVIRKAIKQLDKRK